jgi:hypothetical protein
MGARYSRKKVDFPDAGDPTNKIISGFSGGCINGTAAGSFTEDTVSVEVDMAVELSVIGGGIVGVGM